MNKSKTTNRTILLFSTLALAVVSLVSLPRAAFAAEQMKGAQVLTMKEIKTPAEADALKPGDSVTMVCSKCKSVMLHNVTTEKGPIKVMTVAEKHLCPGCNSTNT